MLEQPSNDYQACRLDWGLTIRNLDTSVWVQHHSVVPMSLLDSNHTSKHKHQGPIQPPLLGDVVRILGLAPGVSPSFGLCPKNIQERGRFNRFRVKFMIRAERRMIIDYYCLKTVCHAYWSEAVDWIAGVPVYFPVVFTSCVSLTATMRGSGHQERQHKDPASQAEESKASPPQSVRNRVSLSLPAFRPTTPTESQK